MASEAGTQSSPTQNRTERERQQNRDTTFATLFKLIRDAPPLPPLAPSASPSPAPSTKKGRGKGKNKKRKRTSTSADESEERPRQRPRPHPLEIIRRPFPYGFYRTRRPSPLPRSPLSRGRDVPELGVEGGSPLHGYSPQSPPFNPDAEGTQEPATATTIQPSLARDASQRSSAPSPEPAGNVDTEAPQASTFEATATNTGAELVQAESQQETALSARVPGLGDTEDIPTSTSGDFTRVPARLPTAPTANEQEATVAGISEVRAPGDAADGNLTAQEEVAEPSQETEQVTGAETTNIVGNVGTEVLEQSEVDKLFDPSYLNTQLPTLSTQQPATAVSNSNVVSQPGQQASEAPATTLPEPASTQPASFPFVFLRSTERPAKPLMNLERTWDHKYRPELKRRRDAKGQVCYVNAILQCLHEIWAPASLQIWFDSCPDDLKAAFTQADATERQKVYESSMKEGIQLGSVLEGVFSTMEPDPTNASSIVYSMLLLEFVIPLAKAQQADTSFGSDTFQQDPSEFFTKLTEFLENEAQRQGTELGFKQTLFQFKELWQTRCDTCQAVTPREQLHDTMMLYMSQAGENPTLEELIPTQFCPASNEEAIDEYECDACGQKGTAFRQKALILNPDTLIMNVSRVGWNNARQEQFKIKHEINGLEEDLDLSDRLYEGPEINWCSPKGARYRLRGVITHKGDVAQAGHYIAFTRTVTGDWYRCDDANIKKLGQMLSFARSGEPCVLFYARI